MKLAERIASTVVQPGTVAIFSIAQAGFAIKTSAGKTVVIDPYLSDCCERVVGFKRMIPTVITPEEVRADLILVTHNHLDHLDIDALPTIAQNTDCLFIGAPDCPAGFRECGIPDGRFLILGEGEQTEECGVKVRAVYCDHADLAPDAMGYVIEVDGVTIYNVGDSGPAYREIERSVGGPVDVMIAPINGAFGNLDAEQAVRLAEIMKPKAVIASHFWMFVEQGGDPALFLKLAERLSETKPVVMAPGELMVHVEAAR